MLWATLLIAWGFMQTPEPVVAIATPVAAIEASETVAPRPAGRPQRARAEQLVAEHLVAEHAAHPTGAFPPAGVDWWERALEDQEAAARAEAGAPASDETSETP